ncbi:MAG: tRNA (guanosine(46)-N7)-methyltransferase TrmB [Candidatus Competibacteraceae bacterium]|nr:tRNA (guanosine(46)-N7)-methyltransferase TrmB [Candidatus Competibacteraceae bacterium]
MHPTDNAKNPFKRISVSDSPKTENYPPHRIRSFIRRESRITAGQQRALNQLWERFGVDIDFFEFDPDQLFGRRAPLILEIGFGDGESLISMCATNPDMDFLGIEIYRPGVGHLLLRAAEMALSNLRIICLDAVEVLERYLPDECLNGVQLFFPDPWPKLRHRKRRLIQPAFVSLVVRKIKAGGQLHIATDCENYAHAILAILKATAELENTTANNEFSQYPPYRPLTKFEQRGKHLGHSVWELLFIKRPEMPKKGTLF